MRNKKVTFHALNDIPLKYKFLLIYLLCVLLPIMSINIYFYQRNSEDIKIREEDNLRKSIDRASAELLALIDEGVALSQSVSDDAALYRSLDTSYGSVIEYYEEYHNFLRGKLERYSSVYPNIKDIRIYTDNQTIQTGSNYYVIDKDDQWLQSFKYSNVNIAIEVIDEHSSLYPGERVSIISKMNNHSMYSAYSKYMRIDLNKDKINAILNRERENLMLKLIDDKGHIISSSNDSSEVNAKTSEGHSSAVEKNSGYVFEHLIGDMSYVKGWRLVGIANTQQIDKLLNAAKRSILGLTLISIIIPTLLIFILFQSYHYRVKKLHRHMHLIQNEKFSLIEIYEGRDEIGTLIRTFNSMISKITSLINEVYKLEIRQKSLELERVRAELNMLQSQMNPHFLFNTLNALLVVSTKKGYSDIADVIKSLAMLMRRLLRQANGLIPIQEELQFTTMYLQIEKFRFGEQFDYEFEMDEQALRQAIPQMSIQPLVENACKHGFNDRRESRKIVVKVSRNERELEVVVRDNGIGMTKEKLHQLSENVRSRKESDNHVGIRNVYRRLELYYGDSVHFFIRSEIGQGTEVGFRILTSGMSGKNKE
ncbi:sensor histidine kinase [Paenibacillus vietnamensis]|uniref:sensor histidine kinase n=1 Tax=Paenibacillus vietnamensis TaxID=2590547 RepID=UPI001CD18FA8|nr:sensor histidine kinase [Paenibacillus vietnamensis]